jgi:hypothetical protein
MEGRNALVMSTDPSHSIRDSLGQVCCLRGGGVRVRVGGGGGGVASAFGGGGDLMGLAVVA